MKIKIVVDANILFSALLSKKNKFLELFFNEEYEFFSPNYIMYEIFKHKEKIIKFSKLSEGEILDMIKVLIEIVNFISLYEIDKDTIKIAKEICEDKGDIPFVAIALFLNARLLTGDRRLCRQLKNKGYNICVSLDELNE